MKVLNWNTKLCDKSQSDTLDVFLEAGVDVACLQEVGNNTNLSNYLDSLDSNDWHVVSKSEGYAGKNYYIVLNKSSCSNFSSANRFDPWVDPELISLNFAWSVELFHEVWGRSPIYIDFSLNGSDYRIANWHAPIKIVTSTGLSRILQGGCNLESMIGVSSSRIFDPTKNAKRTIIAGDLNIVQQELKYKWKKELVAAGFQGKSPSKPQFMRGKTLFDDFLDITPYTTSLEHILVSFANDFQLFFLDAGCISTLGGKSIKNFSDHSLMVAEV